MLAGFAVDFLFRRKEKNMQIEHICEQHHCHCEEGILKSALRHTLEIFWYVLIISFVLNLVISLIGEDVLGNFILNRPLFGEMLAGLVGLIPNCAASVVLTELYLDGVLNAGAMIAGLLVSSGVGVLVLFKVNDDSKENLFIVGLLYVIGVAVGAIVRFAGIVF
jgi:hypothetical protein